MTRTTRYSLLTTAVAASLLLAPTAATAQEAESAEEEHAHAEEDEHAHEHEFDEQIVVLGSRAHARSVTESQVPIDAIPVEDITRQGASAIDYQLRNLIPSFNVATHPISDAATLVRPSSLRNLAHDHTLILVNGKRRHRSSVVAWFGGVTDGAQGPDISTIPAIALQRVEVLRDGASAQYGSDAIAGVINFLLKDDASGGGIELNSGSYIRGDGAGYSVAGNFGLPMGENGFANLSFEYGEADPTSRSVQRQDAAALIAAGNHDVRQPAQIWGNPAVDDDVKLFANIGHSSASGLEFYGFANFAEKTMTEGFFFRNPNSRQSIYSLDGGETLLIGDVLRARGMGSANCPTVTVTDNVPDQDALAQVFADPNCFSFQEVAPGGFTPQFGGIVSDSSIVAGFRKELDNGFTWDLSASLGSHESDFFFRNTVNASLGPDTPRDFDPGLYEQEDVNLNFDISYSVSHRLSVAAGAEWRGESFTIGAGGRPSWEVGPYAEQGFIPASNGFPGFPDYTAGTWSRDNVAVYGDVELHGEDDRWGLGAALRVEDYDVFGNTTNGKLSFRRELSDTAALRGGVSTGFRAPTPGQQNALNVQTTIDPTTLELVDSATVPSTFIAAELRGGKPLQPEESVHTTAGLVIDNGPFTLTADFFNVEIDDRLSLSQVITLTEDERELLLSQGITSARNLSFFRFFINDFSTRTQGIDLVSTWIPLALDGDTEFSFTLNYTDTEVTKDSDLLSAADVLSIERGVPRLRWNFAVGQQVGPVSLLGRLSYYGSWIDYYYTRLWVDSAPPVQDTAYIVDFEASIPIAGDTTLSIGAQNMFDVLASAPAPLVDVLGSRYSPVTPWGLSGGYYYARLNYRW